MTVVTTRKADGTSSTNIRANVTDIGVGDCIAVLNAGSSSIKFALYEARHSADTTGNRHTYAACPDAARPWHGRADEAERDGTWSHGPGYGPDDARPGNAEDATAVKFAASAEVARREAALAVEVQDRLPLQ